MDQPAGCPLHARGFLATTHAKIGSAVPGRSCRLYGWCEGRPAAGATSTATVSATCGAAARGASAEAESDAQHPTSPRGDRNGGKAGHGAIQRRRGQQFSPTRLGTGRERNTRRPPGARARAKAAKGDSIQAAARARGIGPNEGIPRRSPAYGGEAEEARSDHSGAAGEVPPEANPQGEGQHHGARKSDSSEGTWNDCRQHGWSEDSARKQSS